MIQIVPRSEEDRVIYILDAVAKAVNEGRWDVALGIMDLHKGLHEIRRNPVDRRTWFDLIFKAGGEAVRDALGEPPPPPARQH